MLHFCADNFEHAPVYNKLFNCVLDTGIIPDAWGIGVIVPIYKCKGDMQRPEN